MRNGDEEKGPNRTCVATRGVFPVAMLLRFVLDGEGHLTPDLKGKLPGRGVWVSATRKALAEALKKKCFARSLKQPVIAPEGLADQVATLLLADARQSLAMANKAGLVVTGFSKVESAIMAGQAIALVAASDGSEDGKRKILQAVRRSHGQSEALVVYSCLSSHELDLALGRENAIHAALLSGQASDAFVKRCQRLDRYQHGPLHELGPDADEKSASTGPSVLDDDTV